jgi:hypothetical protein
MDLEAVMERYWICNWRSRLSELRDVHGGCDAAYLDMDLEAVTKRVGRHTWRLCSSELEGGLVGYDRARLEDFFGGDQSGGSRWKAHQIQRLYSQVSELEPLEM